MKTLTAPNWSARTRMLSTMLYPDEFVEGAQFSVRKSVSERVVCWIRADRSPRKCLRGYMKAVWARELDWGVQSEWMEGEGTTSVVGSPCDSLQVVGLHSGTMGHGSLLPRSFRENTRSSLNADARTELRSQALTVSTSADAVSDRRFDSRTIHKFSTDATWTTGELKIPERNRASRKGSARRGHLRPDRPLTACGSQPGDVFAPLLPDH